MIEEMCTLPNGWSRSKVGSLCKMIRGVSYPKVDAKKQLSKGYYPVLRGGNIQDEIIFKDLVFVPSKYIKDEQYIRRFDVVLAMSSGSRNIVGKAAQAKEDYKGSFGAFCGLLRPNKQIEPRFFGYYFKTKDYRTKISNLSAGVNINNLRRGYIENLSIPLPPLPEQKRIIAKIENLLDRLNKTKQGLARIPPLIKKFRQSVLARAFSGELTKEWRGQQKDLEPASLLLEHIRTERKKLLGKKYKEPEPINTSVLSELPKRWEWSTVGDIFFEIKNGTTEKQNDEGIGVPVSRIETIQNGVFDLYRIKHIKNPSKDLLETYKYIEDDIALSHINSKEHVGKTAIYLGKPNLFIHGMNLLRLRLSHKFINPMYIYNYFQTYDFRNNVRLKVKHAVNQVSINQKNLGMVPVSIAPIKEQTYIIQIVNQLFSRINPIEKSVKIAQARCEKMTQSILAKAFRGELVSQDSNDKPTSVFLEKIKVKKEKRKKITSKKIKTEDQVKNKKAYRNNQ